ncbi:hypothetical protein G3I40_03750 [Streptomyces sp. SID14478]|uniref:hypothetical protein n=1 Tax=Streptomyces sp. SID14478 TaxID=2706073 RepID=UPI0013D8FCC1|nr:hypothetical protein [Streptomyces sp. SID14478]NEB74350.1 hypothetical protein [Streptomyces sp. SID14478]
MGSPYEHVKRRLKKFAIDTSHFKPPRSIHSLGLFPEEEFTRAVAASHGLTDLMRRLGLPDFNEAARAKARRSIDNHQENLRRLCSNCHAPTKTWSRRNGPRPP